MESEASTWTGAELTRVDTQHFWAPGREESGSSGMLRSELRREVVGGATLEHLNQRWWVREGAQDGWRTALSLQALLVCSRGPFLPP